MVLLRRPSCFQDLLRVPPDNSDHAPPPRTAGYYASFATCRTQVSDRFVQFMEICWVSGPYKEGVFGVFFGRHCHYKSGHCGRLRQGWRIDIDNIVSIQRKASNNTWIVSFNSKVARDDALNQPNVKIAGCMVFLGDCENRVSIVKVYELPVELPDCCYRPPFSLREG